MRLRANILGGGSRNVVYLPLNCSHTDKGNHVNLRIWKLEKNGITTYYRFGSYLIVRKPLSVRSVLLRKKAAYFATEPPSDEIIGQSEVATFRMKKDSRTTWILSTVGYFLRAWTSRIRCDRADVTEVRGRE